jgi:hypothetical protein
MDSKLTNNQTVRINWSGKEKVISEEEEGTA